MKPIDSCDHLCVLFVHICVLLLVALMDLCIFIISGADFAYICGLLVD